MRSAVLFKVVVLATVCFCQDCTDVRQFAVDSQKMIGINKFFDKVSGTIVYVSCMGPLNPWPCIAQFFAWI